MTFATIINEQTDDIYFNQDGTKKEEMTNWYRVDFDGIDTLAELKDYLMLIYTEEMADEIITKYFDYKYTDKQHHYMVYDGYLYTVDGGRGTNISQTPLGDLEAGKIETYSETDGTLTFSYILPVAYFDWDIGDALTKIEFEKGNYEFINTDNGWRLNTFLSFPANW